MDKHQREASHRIALYIRVSTEEQAANPEGSLKNQEERLRQHVAAGRLGEIVGVYIDRARSGKDTNRPELRRMLRAIEQKKISLVAVTEMSRLSRSVKDFTDIWELMNHAGCRFLSLREKFDTTTAAGEMLLLNIASFSQFERRQVSERVSANFLARAKRGLFNGGTIPPGYMRHPEKGGHLAINENEVDLVTTCFHVYLQKESLLAAAQALNESGLRLPAKRRGTGGTPRDGRFSVKNLRSILRNPAYIGLREYTDGGEKKTTPGCWPALIDEETFYAVQKMIDRNRDKRLKLQAKAKRHPYVLSSLVYCGQCGDKLTGKSAHGKTKKIAYYEHSCAIKRATPGEKCDPFRVQAKILEPLVWNHLCELVKEPSISARLFEQWKEQEQDNPAKAKLNSLKTQLSLVKRKQAALAHHLAEIPAGVSAKPLYDQMQTLQSQQENLVTTIEKISRESQVQDALTQQDYQRFLSSLAEMMRRKLSPLERAKVARLLLAKIEVHPHHVRLALNVSLTLEHEGRRFRHGAEAPRRSVQMTNVEHGQLKPSRVSGNLLRDGGSFCLTNGAIERT